MRTVYEANEFTVLPGDFRGVFGGLYGGSQHLGSKAVARYGCGAVTLNSFIAYKERRSYDREALIKDQEAVFLRYLLGPTSALRLKMAALFYYRVRGMKARVEIIHAFPGTTLGLRRMMKTIKEHIDRDNPVPLVIGPVVRKGYKEGLRKHWVLVTGYAEGFHVLVSNNGKRQSLDLKELAQRRLFVATTAIDVEIR